MNYKTLNTNQIKELFRNSINGGCLSYTIIGGYGEPSLCEYVIIKIDSQYYEIRRMQDNGFSSRSDSYSIYKIRKDEFKEKLQHSINKYNLYKKEHDGLYENYNIKDKEI